MDTIISTMCVCGDNQIVATTGTNVFAPHLVRETRQLCGGLDRNYVRAVAALRRLASTTRMDGRAGVEMDAETDLRIAYARQLLDLIGVKVHTPPEWLSFAGSLAMEGMPNG